MKKPMTVQLFDANYDTVYQVKIEWLDDDYNMGILRAKVEALATMMLAHDFNIEDKWVYDE